MRKLLALTAVLAGLLACDEPVNGCDSYVDYMCTCHADDPGFSCDDLTAAYANASIEVQDECAIDLEDQQDADAAAGLVCDAG